MSDNFLLADVVVKWWVMMKTGLSEIEAAGCVLTELGAERVRGLESVTLALSAMSVCSSPSLSATVHDII